jgi:c-di-GMP-binding flagellar brake protein YcgR
MPLPFFLNFRLFRAESRAMQNRRLNYRHSFDADDRLPVELLPPSRESLGGQIVDLSVTGMKVRLTNKERDLPAGERLLTGMSLPGLRTRLRLSATVVYDEPRSDAHYLGLRFLPSANRFADENCDKQIWLFLMDEQRRTIRERRAQRGV